jgi:FkbM family methyltransferase
MQVYYGYDLEHYTDVTNIVFKKCLFDSYILIPRTETERSNIFGDPYYGHLKHILIVDDFGIKHKFAANKEIKIRIDSISSQLTIENNPKLWYDKYGKLITNTNERLTELHKHLELNYGSFLDEYPEQLLSIQYINSDAKVLEIGGNIGRNTLIINSILKDSRNLVTLESSPAIAKQLQENLQINNFDSHIEASALSLVPLIQKGWNTSPLYDNNIPDGWNLISTISFNNLCKKYDIVFDTLVADCEGALYYILKDDPDILNNIHTIILENDFTDISHKEFIDEIFKVKGFTRTDYVEGGWGPCYDFFFEVWKKE